MVIDPLPSHEWFQDMADFADGISDGATGRRLAESLQGEGRSDDSRTRSTNTTPT
jgi:hypothetical protein